MVRAEYIYSKVNIPTSCVLVCVCGVRCTMMMMVCARCGAGSLLCFANALHTQWSSASDTRAFTVCVHTRGRVSIDIFAIFGERKTMGGEGAKSLGIMIIGYEDKRGSFSRSPVSKAPSGIMRTHNAHTHAESTCAHENTHILLYSTHVAHCLYDTRGYHNLCRSLKCFISITSNEKCVRHT